MKTLLASLLLLCPILAQDTAPEPAPDSSAAASLLKQLPKVFQDCIATLQQPWECELSVKGVQDPKGVNSSFQGEGKLAFFYPRMFAAEFSVSMGSAEGSMDATLKLVADDDFLTIEMDMSDSPAGPMTQAFRVSLDLIEELISGDALFSMMEGPEGATPTEMFEMAIDFFAGAEISEKDGTVSLALDIAEYIGEEGEEGKLEIQLQRGKKIDQIFPKSLSVTGEADSSVFLAISKIRYPESFAPERFEYDAPEGVMVMDMTPMLRAQISALGAGGEEEMF